MNKVLILDFGSQYTQLIARRIRENHVYCKIHPFNFSLEQIISFNPQALILSGGPASVLKKGAPKIDKKVFSLGIPVLGICYGMQLMTSQLGGELVSSEHREYGKATLHLQIIRNALFSKVKRSSVVWMSHGDTVKKMPPGFKMLGHTNSNVIAAMANPSQKLYALQFHPEVVHSAYGSQIIKNFLFNIAHIKPDWSMKSFIDQSIQKIKSEVGDDHVILGLSGGVDSSVAAVLIHKAIGDQLTCLFINNGLLRKNEDTQVQEIFKKHYQMKLKYVDASQKFLKGLNKVVDPEKKRKVIGKIFVQVFEQEAKKIKRAKFLAQGTLYPDVIESVSFKGPSAVIKSHHNVGGLPKKMGLKLLEPFRELFKDEVREIGRELGLHKEIIDRHPFPGPGLGIRILGNITAPMIKLVQEADAIIHEEFVSSGWYYRVWQAFAVLLPVKSVGVMGDERTYEHTCVLRVVESQDGMTANWIDLPHEILARISNRIINEVKGINRVVYDISSKPPATIEWE